jgi:hypothetical protein
MPVPVAEGFVAALTYGPKVEWYRNVMAAGHCRIIWQGKEYVIDKHEAMDAQAALPLFSKFERLILKQRGTSNFLKMNTHA